MATQAGVSARSPASPADQAAARRGANITHNSAMTHHTSATSSTTRHSGWARVSCHTIARQAPTAATYRIRPAKRCSFRKADHSQAPASTTAVMAILVAKGGSHSSMTSSSPMRTAAVMIRVLSTRRTPGLLRGAPEAALTGGEECQRRIQLGGIEVRPQAVGEVQLGIGEVPQQEIADAMFAAGADEQVRVRQLRQGQRLPHLLFGDIGGPQRA